MSAVPKHLENGGRVERDLRRGEVSRFFEEYWRDPGEDVRCFTPENEPETPFSAAFVQALPPSTSRVLEWGAGSAVQICDMAKRAKTAGREDIIWHAIESSSTAVGRAVDRVVGQSLDETVWTERADALQYMRDWDKRERGVIGGVYANSFMHIVSAPDRRELLDLVKQNGSRDAVIALSFKTDQDPLSNEGTVVDDHGKEPSGKIVEGRDGIERLFVTNPDILIAEFTGAGYELVQDPLYWEVPGYNRPGMTASFVGFIIRPMQRQNEEPFSDQVEAEASSEPVHSHPVDSEVRNDGQGELFPVSDVYGASSSTAGVF